MKFHGIKHKIELTEGEESMFQALISDRGYREEVIFSIALRMLYKKEFPAYVQKKKGETELPAEEQCIADGGEVVMKDGFKQCYIKRGALEEFRVIV